ncbi:MAG: transcription-repair coupling factor [Clostridiales bacterium]|nr:transcription-repair coupling factor [Clostridiales bacterium]
MDAFVQPLYHLADFEDVEKLIQKQGIIQVSGCLDSQKAHFANGISGAFDFRLIVTENDLKAKEFYEDYRLYDPEALLYPARDLIFYQADIHGNLITKQRIQTLKALLERDQVTVIASMDSCLDYLIPLEIWKSRVLHFKNDSEIDLNKMKTELVELGYERAAQVEVPGQFSIRGGIMDIFSLTEENPWRIELWGDEIDSIRSFDVQSQRSIENLEEISIYPATEMVLDEECISRGLEAIEKEAKTSYRKLRGEFKTEEAARVKNLAEEIREQIQEFRHFAGAESFIHYFYKKTVSFLDYFPEEAIVVLDEPNRLTEHAKATEEEFRESMIHRLEKGYLLPGQMNLICHHQEIVHRFHQRHTLSLSTMEPRGSEWNFKKEIQLTVKSVNPYNNSFEMLLKDLKQWKKSGYQVLLLSPSRTRAARLAEDFQEEGLAAFYSEDPSRLIQKGEIKVACGYVARGFEYPLIKYVVIAESDIFGKEKKKKRKKSEYSGKKIQSFSELSVGDFVVHENHGLGVYKGIEKMEVDGVVKDYIKIEYEGKSNLYILATQLELLQKYAGADAKPPKLNKLGGQEWKKTKTRVRGVVKNIAKDLVELYAARQNSEGFQYGPDTVWQREFEEMFPFEETEDQLLAIDAAKKDMESKKVMDRLICGDVGYGKTEIAIRVAFKAIQEGKQVVYLVPTTILAQQHYNTFIQRMKEFPVRVDLLCRFRTPAQQKKTITDLKKGLVDILIGTHRVLSADVKFKDLGVLIIDEEQRFGVTHKEKIKQLKQNVDVLTLTATPIPRTLHMSLIGIRDMSVLEEAPQDRTPIQTYVMEYNDEMVREAVSREMSRGGQVYYVYNRVNNIAEIANQVAKLVPEANVAFAHGQMSERELEKIMYGFINGDIDVLVSTTIIETGLDISNANTMIIHDADRLGLSQLYQLRGRVGRSNRTAYAFLMYKRDKMLKEVAEKRLHAIREFTELGSGIKIAMRDLELRGAGNLLGAEQHGHMEAVGYDLYCKMLNEAVQEAKGVAVKEKFETMIDINVNAYIPEKYIPNEYLKLDIYKRIAGIESQEEYEDMLEELLDRFGELPKTVQNLLAIANLKALAHRIYLTEVKQMGEELRLTMYEKAKIDPSKVPEILEKYPDELQFKIETNPYFIYRPRKRRGKEKLPMMEKAEVLLQDMQVLVES